MQTAIKRYTCEEYLALEEMVEVKYEFYQGEIFAMSGGTFKHSRIKVNTISALHQKLRGKSCQLTDSDMRIATPSGLMTYPDAGVFCGPPELTDNQRTLLNPVVIIEVLSPSTRRYDKSDKFMLYRSIPSFRDYLLVDSEQVQVQHFRKTENNEWILHEYFDLTEDVYLGSIDESISLAEIYEGMGFELDQKRDKNSELVE